MREIGKIRRLERGIRDVRSDGTLVELKLEKGL